MPLQIRRGTEAERLLLTPTTGLVVGELLYVTDDKRLYIGTGVSGEHQGLQITGYTNEDAQDAVGAAISAGQHVGIVFTYNDSNNTINSRVDLSDYAGTLKADSFKGSLFGDDSSIIVDAQSGRLFGNLTGDVVGSVFADNSLTMVNSVDASFNLDGTIKGHVIPFDSEQYDLGSSAFRFRDLYLSGSTIFLGSSTITSTAGILNLPAGTTIDGMEVATAGDLNVNIVADDSTTLVNIETKTFQGSLKGEVVGSVYDDSSNLIVNATDGGRITTPSLTASEYIKLPVYADQSARNTGLPNGVVEAGMLVFLTDGDGGGNPKIQINTDSTTSGWINLN